MNAKAKLLKALKQAQECPACQALEEAFTEARVYAWQPLNGDVNTQVLCPAALLKHLRRKLTELNQAHVIETWRLEVNEVDHRNYIVSVQASYKAGDAQRNCRAVWRIW